jgi:UDPglucose 6-dehydrogenase
MKNVAVIGAGYAGLAVSIGLAHFGTTVRCLDIDEKKIAMLSRGEVPIHEPGMEEKLRFQLAARRLCFSTDVADGIRFADVVFIAVGTPANEEGMPDVSAVFSVVDMIRQYMNKDIMVVVKSTVPIGTCKVIRDRLQAAAEGKFACHVVANPEFLREGYAIHDFLHPERVVIGVESEVAERMMRELYAPLVRAEVPFFVTNYQTAEMIKYSANSFLAMKVAFINEIARLCDAVGADVMQISQALGVDPRIGHRHLLPGPGYGGSCLPKDTKAFTLLARQAGAPLPIIEAVMESNAQQQAYVVDKLKRDFSTLQGRLLAIFGLAFKAGTDDMRDSSAIPVIDRLLAEGASVKVYDPQAMEAARAIWGKDIQYGKDAYETAQDAEAVIILTEWPEFAVLQLEKLADLMADKRIYDFRNLYSRDEVEEYGFYYQGIGR